MSSIKRLVTFVEESLEIRKQLKNHADRLGVTVDQVITLKEICYRKGISYQELERIFCKLEAAASTNNSGEEK